jgi:NADPH-dependent curcumin reductase CurA
MVLNKAFMYKAVPHGWPKPGHDLSVESSDFDEFAAPPKKGFTTRNLYAAFDPTQRTLMRDPAIKSYSPPMQLGQPVTAVTAIGRVLKSDCDKFKVGDLVLYWMWPTESYSAVPEELVDSVQLLMPTSGVPLTAYLGALGMTGLTAYGSLHEIGQPKKGETIWISGAAGSVGQTVGQIAVREGLTVIGSVGNDKKLEFITKELGFTSGFNYKEENPLDAIKRLAPNGIDIYFDNVGGEALDAALLHLKHFGRIGQSGTAFFGIAANSVKLLVVQSQHTMTRQTSNMVSRITITS